MSTDQSNKDRPAQRDPDFEHLRQQLMRPPSGWWIFGAHVDEPVELEFWGVDVDGLPLWERLKPAAAVGVSLSGDGVRLWLPTGDAVLSIEQAGQLAALLAEALG